MKNFKTTYYQIPLDHEIYRPFQKIRIVLLSDLHNQVYGPDNSVLLAGIRQLKPDLILAAGDILNCEPKRREDAALSVMTKLAKVYPVYYGNGNHEYRMKLDTQTFGLRYAGYAKHLRAAGVYLLENEWADISLKGMRFRIYGLELPWRFYQRTCRERLTAAQMEQLLGKKKGERYVLLIAHNPVHFPAYAAWGADLTVSGHLHGGFVRLPLLGGVVSPQFRLFPKYARGVFEEKGKFMAVSTGIGTHSMLPRLGNPTEVVVLDLF